MKKSTHLFIILFIMGILFSTSDTVNAAESKNYYIKVNKGTNVVTVYKSDGTPYKAMICSAGIPTPIGTFYTPVKYRWKELIGPSYGQYSTRIVDGVLFHSVYYWTNGDKSTMSTSAYNLLGTLQSHGCIRLLMKDAKWIYDNCALGTKVIIFNGTSKDDPLGKPTYAKIPNEKYTNWDPTDPDPANPWNKCKPTITLNVNSKIQVNSAFKPLTAVTVKDSLGNIITKGINVKGSVNTKKLGKYKIKYSYTDSLGRSVKKTITYNVVDSAKPAISGVKKKTSAVGQSINLAKNITAKAASGTNLTSRIKVYYKTKNSSKYKFIKNGTKTFKTAGTYDILYYVKGLNGKTQRKYTTLKVVDKRVKLTVKDVTIEYGAAYKPNSYVTLKNYKGSNISLSKNLTVKNTVNTTKVGTYKVTYTGMVNKLKYTKVTKTASVKVVNNKAPVITGVNKNTVYITAGNNTKIHLLSGVTAKTATGVNITSSIKVYVNGVLYNGSEYNFNNEGTYNIVYKVTVPTGTKTATAGTTIIVTAPEQETTDIE